MPSGSDNNDYSIVVKDVSVTYRTAIEGTPTVKNTIKRLGRRQRIVREVEALKGVNFRIKRGAVYGVVGTNGAGKARRRFSAHEACDPCTPSSR